MQRSLFSGVSGLTNHQAILDATANNLANISTNGFKGNRVSFSTALTQTQSAGSSPTTAAGGVNPRQIGLGVRNSSVDVDMRQGALQSTGRTLDLAIQGNGFFRVTGADGTDAYTRVGNFGFDAKDNLVDLGSGMVLQGRKLDTTGAATGNRVGINISESKSIDSKATDNVVFQGNLDKGAGALRGKSLTSVLPLLRQDTGAAAIESTELSKLAIFQGQPVDPGAALSNSFDISTTNLAATTETQLNANSALVVAGKIRSTIIVPAADFSANALTLRLREGSIATGTIASSLIVNTDLSNASLAERTFTLESTNDFAVANPVTVTAESALLRNAGNLSVVTDVLKTIHAFGTTPRGDAWAGSFDIDPWKDTVQNLVAGFKSILQQGSENIGTVKLENGSLLATGEGDGFSLFFGENPGISSPADITPIQTSGSAVGSSYDGTALLAAPAALSGDAWRVAAGSGNFNSLSVDVTGADYTGALTTPTITVYRNGVAVTTGTIVAGNYATKTSVGVGLGAAVAVAAGDVITYKIHGNYGAAITAAAPATFGVTPPLPVGVSITPAVAYGTADLKKSRLSEPMTVRETDAGLVKPTVLIPPGTYTGDLNVKLMIGGNGGKEMGTITIPAGTYNSTNNTFTINSFPHVKAGDQITYTVSGTMDLGGNSLFFDTAIYRDSNVLNMTSDTINAKADAVADGMPDMFQESSSVDISAWQYDKNNNATFDWYRARFSPETVTSSIQVYDSAGGAHTVEARFFRVGTRPESGGTNNETINAWEMMVNISPLEGQIKDGLVTGIEFDNKGRYVGNARLGSTIAGNSLSDATRYVGTPSDSTLTINWAGTGGKSMSIDFGQAAATTGLTGFGSASTAAAIDQDGYAAGSLDSYSVNADGAIVGLYSNGKSRSLYQVEVATFRNSAGLTSSGNNLWQVSANSGDALSRTAGSGGAGTITSGALEGSNVDIASEFTRLITAQRGFQVNSRVIQTTDSILQELAGLIRG